MRARAQVGRRATNGYSGLGREAGWAGLVSAGAIRYSLWAIRQTLPEFRHVA
ncbi:hypothetical protein [Bosea lathyri]|uniref:hypothetical protein n=1 Tax=Bosea lathyri TaxID=1036778 RepID=UPI00135BC173|nr:hypothetical protein [Bosea lathyri]